MCTLASSTVFTFWEMMHGHMYMYMYTCLVTDTLSFRFNFSFFSPKSVYVTK